MSAYVPEWMVTCAAYPDLVWWFASILDANAHADKMRRNGHTTRVVREARS